MLSVIGPNDAIAANGGECSLAAESVYSVMNSTVCMYMYMYMYHMHIMQCIYINVYIYIYICICKVQYIEYTFLLLLF